MVEIPTVVKVVCGLMCFTATVMSCFAIHLQMVNYRKPLEQRLIIRILLVVPMFAVSCYASLINYKVEPFIEPIREMYEAIVIYTFYKLLVFLLGGEKAIVQNSENRLPTNHFFPLSLIMKPIEISDPKQFLMIKRMILQYVWMKPLLFIIIWVSSVFGWYDVNDISFSSVYFWIGVAYNASVSLSLYYLGLFWKCLYGDLKKFHPWPKFLCVKIIIFASYWQGIFVETLNWLGVIHNDMNDSKGSNTGMVIQNVLLCLEMVGFAWLHWVSFSYTEFTSDKFPDCARVKTWNAFKDWIRVGDLIYDLKTSMLNGASYNFRNFDSVNDLGVYQQSEAFNKKIYQGLRVRPDGKKYWINGMGTQHPSEPIKSTTPLMNKAQNYSYTTFEDRSSLIPEDENDLMNDPEFGKDEKQYQYAKQHYLTAEDINYPVVYKYNEIEHSRKILRMRQELENGV